MSLFVGSRYQNPLLPTAEAQELARRAPNIAYAAPASPEIDGRMLEVYARAQDPEDPIELRDLYISRVESELGNRNSRASLSAHWLGAPSLRSITAQEVLSFRSTPRFIKELFNWYFRNDLYGDLRAQEHIILSSGSVDETEYGLPEVLKQCVRYALNRDWYGYSDSCGRIPPREALAALENRRLDKDCYRAANVALTMGGTFAMSSLADFILLGRASVSPALCAIPNYPPLVESVARRTEVELIPVTCANGVTQISALIQALRPSTPFVLLQTVTNPTGTAVSEDELEALIGAASPSTMIVLDECHEWLGTERRRSLARAAPNVVRVSSLSKEWSAPGLKVGWILADSGFMSNYYEYASTTFGGPPSLYYTLVEVVARLERWLLEGTVEPGGAELSEFESSYGLTLDSIRAAYESYREERRWRKNALVVQRDATAVELTRAGLAVVRPTHSINVAAMIPEWTDSYVAFRKLLMRTGVSVFPGILTFWFSGAMIRLTSARRWDMLATALSRLRERS